MNDELAGKVALVTGASRGIGRAIAELFVQAGAKVAICARKQESIDSIAVTGMLPIECHVGRLADLERMVERTQRELGPIDVLVNNAATNIQLGPCLEADEGQFDKMVQINVKSIFHLVRLVAPGMCERGSGSIINIASVAGVQPQYESLLYSMTKAALIMMTKSYALELGPKGVRVNAIAPGLVQTTLSEYFWGDKERRARFVSRQPVRRLGQPRDIAEIALTLASDHSSFMTGQVVVVDGGLLIS
jgi:NAD(P)-dependent dehydrogenase (short-subunit alcohol dehydrogenase family)